MTAPKKTVRSATPVDEDVPLVGQNVDDLVAELQAQMAAQQQRIDSLMAERGIPADPVAAKIQALQDHLRLHAAANPNHAEKYAPVVSYVDKLTSDSVTPNKALKASNLVSALHTKHGQHELGYAATLAEELHNLTLDPEDD